MSPPIIIMGAHGGVGEALARHLSAQDLPVFLTVRDGGFLHAITRELGARGSVCNVLENNEIEAAIADADNGDGIAGFAYCIGSIDLKPLKAATDEDFLRAYRVNVLGAVRALRAAARGLRKAKGAVVLFSTVAVAQGFANHAVISSAKGGIEGLTRALAAEWAPHVRVNAIAPSLTETPLAAPLTENEPMARGIAQLHAIPRLGTAVDMVHAASFLLGPESAWITGQILAVDGGRTRVRTKG